MSKLPGYKDGPSLKLSATLSIYFAKQFTMYVVGMFIAIISVVFLIDTIELIRRFASKDNLNVILVLKMAALKAPEISQKIFPFSVLFGSTMFFTKMVKNQEFTAAQSSGQSIWQFLLPTLFVVIVLGLFSLLQGVMPFALEINTAFVAAVLTVVGYSINDTVVVFDRVRENLRKYKNIDLIEVFNMSINNTLSRTVMTSITTLLALISLYLFGGEVIKPFALTMIIGVLVGTYSSIFIAVPTLLVFKFRPQDEDDNEN